MPNERALLVEQGASFESFIVTQPGCTPPRASLFRGQYGHKRGVLRSPWSAPSHLRRPVAAPAPS